MNGASGIDEEKPEKAQELLNAQTLLSDEDCELAVLATKNVKTGRDQFMKFSQLTGYWKKIGGSRRSCKRQKHPPRLAPGW